MISELLFKSLIVSSTFDYICNSATFLSFSPKHSSFAKILESVGYTFSDNHIIFLKNRLHIFCFYLILLNFGTWVDLLDGVLFF